MADIEYKKEDYVDKCGEEERFRDVCMNGWLVPPHMQAIFLILEGKKLKNRDLRLTEIIEKLIEIINMRYEARKWMQEQLLKGRMESIIMV